MNNFSPINLVKISQSNFKFTKITSENYVISIMAEMNFCFGRYCLANMVKFLADIVWPIGSLLNWSYPMLNV